MTKYSQYETNSPIVKNGRMHLTSDYKTRNKKRPGHCGMDFTSLNETCTSMICDYIVAMADGVVSSVNYDSKSGYYIFIKHENGAKTFYCHLKKGSIVVKKNQKVVKGQVIAYMGSTGASTGAHIHVGVKINGVWVDPQPYLKGTKNFNVEPKYKTGKYEVISPRYVRTGPGTNYRIKKVQELTVDGQLHCVNKKKTADAQYKKSTIFTALEIAIGANKSTWAKTPSGYVCIASAKGKEYCKRVG